MLFRSSGIVCKRVCYSDWRCTKHQKDSNNTNSSVLGFYHEEYTSKSYIRNGQESFCSLYANFLQNLPKSTKLRYFFSNFQKVSFLHENWYFSHKKLGTEFLGIFSPATILPKISHFLHSKWRSAMRSAMMFQNIPQ